MNRMFIDVREKDEFDEDHIDGAVNLPPSAIMAGAPALLDVPKNTELVLYCMSGARANASMSYLNRLGFTNVVNGINKELVREKYSVK